MALSYASPGVYVEEVDRGTKPIEAVGTSIAAFVGITAEASMKAIDAATGERVVVESRLNKIPLGTIQANLLISETIGQVVVAIITAVISLTAAVHAISPACEPSARARAMSNRPLCRSRSRAKAATALKLSLSSLDPAPMVSKWSSRLAKRIRLA